MRVVLPFVMLDDLRTTLLRDTHTVALSLGIPVEHVDVSEDGGYPHLLQRLWSEGEGVILIEHDVVPTQEQLQQLVRCEHDWCAYTYHPHAGASIEAGAIAMFGCCKLGEETMQRLPRVWSSWGTSKPAEPWMLGTPNWAWLDTRLTYYAREKGIRAHQHWPDVEHRKGSAVSVRFDGRPVDWIVCTCCRGFAPAAPGSRVCVKCTDDGLVAVMWLAELPGVIRELRETPCDQPLPVDDDPPLSSIGVSHGVSGETRAT